MATKALFVKLEAKPGKEDAVEEFLLSALPLVEEEPGTYPWFAVRFDSSTFGMIDAFPDRVRTRRAPQRSSGKSPQRAGRRALGVSAGDRTRSTCWPTSCEGVGGEVAGPPDPADG